MFLLLIVYYYSWIWFDDYNKILGNGFDHVPGDIHSTQESIYTNTSAYAFHYYCTAIDTSYPKYSVICDSFLGPEIFKSATETVNKLGGAAILTEFEICSNPHKNPNEITLSWDTGIS